MVDRQGKVIGIVTARLDSDPDTGRNIEGVGYALGSEEILARLDFLSSGGQALFPHADT